MTNYEYTQVYPLIITVTQYSPLPRQLSGIFVLNTLVHVKQCQIANAMGESKNVGPKLLSCILIVCRQLSTNMPFIILIIGMIW